MPSHHNHRRRGYAAARFAAVVVTVLTVAGCSDSIGPLPSEGAPDDLQFQTSGYGVESRTLQMRGDTVLTWRRPWDWRPGMAIDTVRVVPSAQAWASFWDAAGNAGVRGWRRNYKQDNVVDGSGWSLRIVTDEGTLQSQGSNAFPDARGRERYEMPDEFRAFVEAMGDLVGQPLL